MVYRANWFSGGESILQKLLGSSEIFLVLLVHWFWGDACWWVRDRWLRLCFGLSSDSERSLIYVMNWLALMSIQDCVSFLQMLLLLPSKEHSQSGSMNCRCQYIQRPIYSLSGDCNWAWKGIYKGWSCGLEGREWWESYRETSKGGLHSTIFYCGSDITAN